MSRTKTFFNNVFFSSLLSVVTIIVGFIIPKVMLKYYGSEVNGLVSSITQFISYFNIVEAGLANAAVFALYRPIARKNKKRISEILSTTKSFYYLSGLIFLILVFALSIVYPILIKTDVLNNFNIILLILSIGFLGVLEFFTLAKYRVIFTADQKLYIISISSIVYLILHALIITIFSALGFSIVFVRFFSIFAIIIRSIILIVYSKKYYNYVNYNLKPKKKLINKRWDALYLQILGLVQNGIPYILLTLFSTLINVSIYTIYSIVFIGINNLLSIFINGLSSAFGEIIAKKQFNVLKKAYYIFQYIYYNLLTIVYSLSYILILPFIKIYTKGIEDANYFLPIVAVLFVINGFLYNLKTPQGMLVHSGGLYKETRLQSTIQALIIVILGTILVPQYNIVGILIAAIVSNLYRIIDFIIFIPKHIKCLSSKKIIFGQVKAIILSIIIIFACNKLGFIIDGYFSWLFFAIIYGCISLGIVLLFDIIFERKNLKDAILRIKLIFRKKANNEGEIL